MGAADRVHGEGDALPSWVIAFTRSLTFSWIRGNDLVGPGRRRSSFNLVRAAHDVDGAEAWCACLGG